MPIDQDAHAGRLTAALAEVERLQAENAALKAKVAEADRSHVAQTEIKRLAGAVRGLGFTARENESHAAMIGRALAVFADEQAGPRV